MILACLTILVVAGPVTASNLLGHRAGWDSTVKVNKVALSAQFNTQVNNVLSESVNPTDITLQIAIDQAAANWEVNIYDANYGDTGWAGHWNCQVWGSMTVCTQGRVRLNQVVSYTNQEAKSLACEEIGHSLGLAHSNEVNASCMSQQWNQTKLSTHDRNHLNSIY